MRRSPALLLVILAAALAGCGRRGPLEPPEASVPAVQAATPAPSGQATDRRLRPGATTRSAPVAPRTLATSPGGNVVDALDEDDEETDPAFPASPQPTPSRKRSTPYVVPKEPFILDPLL